jgi:hypothetical protein
LQKDRFLQTISGKRISCTPIDGLYHLNHALENTVDGFVRDRAVGNGC